MAKTIDELDKQIRQMQAQKEAILQKQKKAERENLTRQKIIIGGWMLANDLVQVEAIKSQLTRDQDRTAFGLPVLDAKKASETADAAKVEKI